VRNPSDADVESVNRLHAETTPRRSVLEPAIVPVDLTSSDRTQPGEELPFAPGGEPAAVPADRDTSLVALATAFRWRKPLMIVLAVAVAASVALAARRNSTVDTSGRDSGAMSAPDLDDSPDSPSVQAGEVASEASGDATGRGAGAEETGAAGLPGASSGRDAAPLQITAPPSSSTTVDRGAAAGPSTATGSSGATATTAGAGAAASTATSTAASSAAGTASASSARQSTTAEATGSTEPITTTDRTATTGRTTTQRSTTTQRTTTTRQSTTTQRTTTTVVLVGSSAGGFESPSIRQDMVWLNNGEVGRWRSTNGDIQLMRSGFEGIASVDGGQYAELNSSSQGGLYRSLTVQPGTTVEWEFLHRARSGTEQIEVGIGVPSSMEVVDTVQATTQWVSHSGRWRVPNGVTSVRFTLWSTEPGPYGNLVDAVRVVAVEG